MESLQDAIVTSPPAADPPLSDLARLAVAARAGRKDDTERLWQAVRPRLTRIALGLGVRAADVPDLVQEAMFAGHRALARFNPRNGSFEAWIATILVRRARNLARAQRRRWRLLDVLRRFGRSGGSPSPRALDPLESRMVVERLLGCLTVSQREVVALYEIGGMEAGEAARILGITAAGVRSISRDARIRLSEEARRTEEQVHGPGADREERS
jgi:RNA polymerase sigma factor (sigma-70 family)